ncbi:MAG: hypothetical protein KC635_09205 [Myxococcales bacterium]|nr:hypothetical protein [Myxococcales bacterium]MCB9731928.1 hypothetical protein [Deltaproteobacteria bacterium]
MSRLAATVALALTLAPSGAAVAAAATGDPQCAGKFQGNLCDLPDGAGGFCAPADCDGARCLVCVPAPNDTDEPSSIWVPMLAFGVTVTGVGGIFWLRLRKTLE